MDFESMQKAFQVPQESGHGIVSHGTWLGPGLLPDNWDLNVMSLLRGPGLSIQSKDSSSIPQFL